MTYHLYGMPGSLYTAKARAYLRKNRVAYEELAVGTPHYADHIMPRIKRWLIPVLEAPDGTLIQDSQDIIDFGEAQGLSRWPVYPADPALNAAGWVLAMFAGEGLLRPAMHYRWNFDTENLAFIREDFLSALAPGATEEDRDMRFTVASSRMRAATIAFGVSAETIPLVEASYLEFLTLLNDHLAHAPYMLGGHATLADYSLMGPLYAHLARDPKPAMVMKQHAPRVWRWVERMNTADRYCGEYVNAPETLFAADALPASLGALLRYIAADYLPEVEAFAAGANAWLTDRAAGPFGEVKLDHPTQRALGMVPCTWRGKNIQVGILPYRILMLQHVQQAADAAPEAAALLVAHGLASLLTSRVARRIERVDHLERWAALTPAA